jgi:hypothetical protein
MLPAWMIADVNKRKDDERSERHIGDEDTSPYRTPTDNDSTDNDTDGGDTLNCGGNAPSPPPAKEPMAEARAQQALDDHRAEVAETNRIAEEKRAATKLEADKTAFQSRLGGAYANAQNYGSSRLRNLGINDDYGILNSYETALQKAKGVVPELDPNPGSYFGNDLFENVLGETRTGQRSKLTKGYESEVPQGFESTYIPDTADDALINSIIGEQFGEAGEYLNRAKARGTLNDVGYNTANRALGQQRAGAVERANQLGLGVLETGRTSLKDIDKQARQGITNWDFGDSYDPSSWSGKIKSGASSFTGGLEGKLRNTFGETEFFDPEALIAKGGKAQGAVNPGASALQDAMTEEERRRTAGSVGAF